jgi:hypothetical protein
LRIERRREEEGERECEEKKGDEGDQGEEERKIGKERREREERRGDERILERTDSVPVGRVASTP